MAPPRLSQALLSVASLLVVHAAQDRTITQVVKVLQNMADQSKADGNSERDLYAKFKCYCDTEESSKTAEIETLTSTINLLENEITELMASTGTLSQDLQQIKRDIATNGNSQSQATTQRNKENEEFGIKEADLSDAIDRMKTAIQVLADVGADQSSGDAARDHTQFMANYKPKAGLAELGKTVKLALAAASSIASPKQVASIESFIQGTPFTGTYSAHSGQVVGILKDMRDTFKANLKAATEDEDKALKAYTKLMTGLGEALVELQNEMREKEQLLAGNDVSLGSKRTELRGAKEDKASAESFLATLQKECANKKKQYGERVRLRSQEEAALAEAISILNSDSAFATFGKVDATRTGATSFVQYSSIRRHGESDDDSRRKAQAFLQQQASNQKSPLLGKVVALLQAHNPFAVVLAEIEKLVAMIAAEEKADDEQLSWCTSERTNTQQSIEKKGDDVTGLEQAIHGIVEGINHPVTGLLKRKSDTEEALTIIHEIQVAQTAQRQTDNQAYQEDMKHLSDAAALLQRAIVVLRKYYSKIDSEISSQFLQEVAAPAPPATWDDEYKGQRDGSRSAVTMLEFILTETKTEETQAHDAELSAQQDFEDAMGSLKTDEGNLRKALETTETDLAELTRLLDLADKELRTTKKEKGALEKYLKDIKPGCDFITQNIAARKEKRTTETDALNQATQLLKNSPAYINARTKAAADGIRTQIGCGACKQADGSFPKFQFITEAAVSTAACESHCSMTQNCVGFDTRAVRNQCTIYTEDGGGRPVSSERGGGAAADCGSDWTCYSYQVHIEGLGDCQSICQVNGEEHVECKACLAKTSVPGYCAGHPATTGC